jgi:hypothetical protein
MGLSPPFHKFFTEVHKRACRLLICPRTHTIPWFYNSYQSSGSGSGSTGSVPLNNGSGSGSCSFCQWPSTYQQQQNVPCFLLITFWRYIYIILQRQKVILKSQNSWNKDFSYYFCLMMKGSRSEAGSVPADLRIRLRIREAQKTYGSGSGTLINIEVRLMFSYRSPIRKYMSYLYIYILHANFIKFFFQGFVPNILKFLYYAQGIWWN